MKSFLAIAAVVLPLFSLRADPFAESTRICILVATEKDAAVFERASSVKPVAIRIAGWNFRTLQVGGRKILLGKLGRGPVEATASATAALSLSPAPWYLISVSPAAGLCSQPVGTIALVSKTSAGEDSDPVNLPEKMPEGVPPTPEFPLRSVESFVDSDSESAEISAQGFCLIDMNAHWLSLASARASVKHIPVRVVSDAADSSAGESFRQFISSYDGSAARRALEIVSHLPVPENSALAHENLRSAVLGKKSQSSEKKR